MPVLGGKIRTRNACQGVGGMEDERHYRADSIKFWKDLKRCGCAQACTSATHTMHGLAPLCLKWLTTPSTNILRTATIGSTHHACGRQRREDYGAASVDEHPEFGISAAEVIMTKLHAGGKFDNAAYKVSGGLHGVGVSAVNAVSAWLDMTIERDGAVHKQRYERGEPASALEVAGKTESTGTTIRFRPDLTIFSDIVEFDFDILDTRFRETAFLNAGLHPTHRRARRRAAHRGPPLRRRTGQFVQRLNDRRQVLHDDVIHISGEREIELGEVSVDLAMQWSDAFSEQIQCYTNIIRNRDGGTHLTGLRVR